MGSYRVACYNDSVPLYLAFVDFNILVSCLISGLTSASVQIFLCLYHLLPHKTNAFSFIMHARVSGFMLFFFFYLFFVSFFRFFLSVANKIGPDYTLGSTASGSILSVKGSERQRVNMSISNKSIQVLKGWATVQTFTLS